MEKINLFEYDDYRLFLKDWFQLKKKEKSSYSLKAFSNQAGFSSPNVLKQVMDGHRNLSKESIEKFSKGLKLDSLESAYFEQLVLYKQSQSKVDKEKYQIKLFRLKQCHFIEPIPEDKYSIYSEWYHLVVRELVISKDYNDKAEWISKKLRGRVSLEDVTQSIQILEENGLIKRNKSGRWEQTNPLTSTGNQVDAKIFVRFHQLLFEVMRSYLQYYDSQKKYDKLDISSLILGVPLNRIDEIKKKIQNFRKEILELVADDASPEEVLLLNMQMIPLTD